MVTQTQPHILNIPGYNHIYRQYYQTPRGDNASPRSRRGTAIGLYHVRYDSIASLLSRLSDLAHNYARSGESGLGPLMDKALQSLPARWIQGIAHDRPGFQDGVRAICGRLGVPFVPGQEHGAIPAVHIEVHRSDGSLGEIVRQLCTNARYEYGFSLALSRTGPAQPMSPIGVRNLLGGNSFLANFLFPEQVPEATRISTDVGPSLSTSIAQHALLNADDAVRLSFLRTMAAATAEGLRQRLLGYEP